MPDREGPCYRAFLSLTSASAWAIVSYPSTTMKSAIAVMTAN